MSLLPSFIILCMGSRTGTGIGRLLRELGMTTSQIILLVVFIVVGGIAFMVIGEQRKKKTLQKAAFQGITFGDETGILHLVARGAAEPQGKSKVPLMSRLRSFETADEVYEYVYKKFDEAVFEKILVHKAGVDAPVEFVLNTQESDDKNRARLATLTV
jgi:hypothetical protein